MSGSTRTRPRQYRKGHCPHEGGFILGAASRGPDDCLQQHLRKYWYNYFYFFITCVNIQCVLTLPMLFLFCRPTTTSAPTRRRCSTTSRHQQLRATKTGCRSAGATSRHTVRRFHVSSSTVWSSGRGWRSTFRPRRIR